MLGRLLGIPHEEYPPENPPVYGCDTLDEHMEAAAWDLGLHGLKGRSSEAAALYNSLFDLENVDMTECTRVVLGFAELAPLAFARQDELAARGIDICGLCAEPASSRAFQIATQSGALSQMIAATCSDSDANRR